MSLSRGRYGVEWVAQPAGGRRNPSGFGWVLLLVGLVALISFSATFVRRIRMTRQAEVVPSVVESPVLPASAGSGVPEAVLPEFPVASDKAVERVAETNVDQDVSAGLSTNLMKDVSRAVTEKRPVRVRNLLLRLEKAEERRDIEMAVSTIEQLRALPGSPAADLDDALARRLGVLNMRRLFVSKTPLWVERVEVRRGDSATRIAAEHGSTFASFARLNGGHVKTVRLGQKVYVMRHPRFTLVVHRRARTADLLLKEKFFKRYDLRAEPTGEVGAYETGRSTAASFKSLGISLKQPDLTELELLLPVGTGVLISEM